MNHHTSEARTSFEGRSSSTCLGEHNHCAVQCRNFSPPFTIVNKDDNVHYFLAQLGNFRASSIQSRSCNKWLSRFSTSRNFWPARVWGATKRQKTCRLAKSPGSDPFNKGIRQLLTLLDKCLNLYGDYMEKWFLETVQLDTQIPFNIFIYSSLHVSRMTCSKHVENYK